MTYSITFLACHYLLLMWSSFPGVDAVFIIRSIHDNSWATGLGRYEELRRILTVGTKFHDGEGADSVSGDIDTDCQLLLADGSGHWTELPFETPQLCVGGVAVFQNEPGAAVIVGIAGNQSSLVNIDDVGTDSPQPGTSFEFQEGINKIPVATARGDPSKPYIYVALHDIDGNAKFSGFGNTRANNLQNMMNYWETLTHPAGLAQTQPNHVPHIIKINPSTGATEWLEILNPEVGTLGAATIASIEYANNVLIVCGSTNSVGEAFGSSSGTDVSWDGYVVFIDPTTGSPDSVFVHPTSGITINRPSIRIRSTTTDASDYVHDSCMIGSDLYVVGTTAGQFDADDDPGGAFVIRIDTLQRTITGRLKISTKERTGKKIACSSDHVYIAGHVLYPSDIEKQDVYVTAYDKDLETLQWDVIVDSTPYFEESRRNQLVDIEVNPALDVNVLWNSQKLDDGINNILFMDLQAGDGSNEIQKGATASGGAAGIPDDGIAVEPVPGSGSNNSKKEATEKGLAIGLGLGIPIALAIGVATYTYLSSKSEVEKIPAVEGDETEPVEAGATTGSVV
jgi:hypothetical protein